MTDYEQTLNWARTRVGIPRESPARDAAVMLLDAEIVIRSLLQLVKVTEVAGQLFVGPIELDGGGRNCIAAAQRWLAAQPWYCEAPATCEGPCGECWAENVALDEPQ